MSVSAHFCGRLSVSAPKYCVSRSWDCPVVVCCHYNVIEFSERPLLFHKIQFYPAIYHSASTLPCLSLFSLAVFLLSSHSLMWVINEALVGRPSSPYVSGVSQQHVSHTLYVSHSFIHTLVAVFYLLAFFLFLFNSIFGFQANTLQRLKAVRCRLNGKDYDNSEILFDLFMCYFMLLRL